VVSYPDHLLSELCFRECQWQIKAPPQTNDEDDHLFDLFTGASQDPDRIVYEDLQAPCFRHLASWLFRYGCLRQAANEALESRPRERSATTALYCSKEHEEPAPKARYEKAPFEHV
jgi:hypothetical protein